MKAITNDWLNSAESDLAIIKLIIHDESRIKQNFWGAIYFKRKYSLT
jgi:hypothetical protein